LLVAAAANTAAGHHHPHHHRTPLLQEIGNVRKSDAKKLYSSANDLVDSPVHTCGDVSTPTDGVSIGNNSVENIDDYNDEEDNSSSSSFVVGCVRKTKRRERSKSKDSASYVVSNNNNNHSNNNNNNSGSNKRRDSSESRLTSLADFFRSPSGSRKSSLNNERKNSNNVTIKINDSDGLESSPENSVAHKSRVSKSPLRVFSKVKAWGSRDALDDKSNNVKVEYTMLQDNVTLPRFERQQLTTPSFLTANSREGIDFENLESELCNLESEQANDDGNLTTRSRINDLKLLQELDFTKDNERCNHFSDNEADYGSDDDTEDLIDDDGRVRNDDDPIQTPRTNESMRIIESIENTEGANNHQTMIGSFVKPNKMHVTKKFFRKNCSGIIKKS
jgi:hypothetical protein